MVCESLCTSGCVERDTVSVSPTKLGSQAVSYVVPKISAEEISHVYFLPNHTCLAKRLGHMSLCIRISQVNMERHPNIANTFKFQTPEK